MARTDFPESARVPNTGRPAAAGTQVDLGTPPPRPKETRRFYGTHAQIRSGLTFYRVMAIITGVFLLIMVAKILVSGSLFGWTFWEGYELYVGGTTVEGDTNTIGFYPADSLQDARSTSTMIAQAHGVAYIIYLVAGFRLWYMLRWGAGRLALIISGGLVPFFSFFVERRVSHLVRADLAQTPEAAPRY
ncbi:DUF3817 domain-containing protein [Nesterenkonia alkaliphila]|uniref:DUF3817 domain-containing protein n=2 Tax=Nesterenkonia alkaliphila TaxID=1463631 RepID=A0A7K1UFE1_9MICC|nr:DUF3817 domain-containing protein [Nesterenkonia alkaliphila]